MKPRPLLRLAVRLFVRRRGTMLFFAGSLGFGIAFLSAVGHMLATVDAAVARRARELLAGDVQVVSSLPFNADQRAALSSQLTPGRRAAHSVLLASMISPGAAGSSPFLVAVKAVDGAYPLRGELVTRPPGLKLGPGACLIERSAALSHDVKVGDAVRLGALPLRVAGIIDQEPDRDFFGFAFAPRLIVSAQDLPRSGLLGFGARVRYVWTLSLGDSEDAASSASSVKSSLQKSLPDPHLNVATYRDGESAVRDGLRRSGIFFTALSLAALTLGAAGLRAGLSLFLDAESETMGLLRCLGTTVDEIAKLYACVCVGAGLLGGCLGALAGWAIAAAAARAAGRFGLILSAPLQPGLLLECLILSGTLSWGLSSARIRALASRAPLDALRAPPATSRALALLGWSASLLVGAAAAYRRAPSTRDAAILLGALAVGAVVVEGLSRAALALGARAAEAAEGHGLAFPIRHGLRRLVRRPDETRVMLFTLAGAFALLGAVAAAREGFSRELAPTQAENAADLFLIDVQPDQLDAVRRTAAKYSRAQPAFSPLVRARLTEVDGRALARGDDRPGKVGERGRWRSREYNLTFARTLNASESAVAGRFWGPDAAGAQASVEKDFADRAGVALGSRLTFDVSGRQVQAVVTSLRRVEWATMLPNFFVTLTPDLIGEAPRTYIASLRARDPAASAELRRALSRRQPNVSVVDAAALLETARKTLALILAAIEALAWFCVLVGALVAAGLVALGRGQRAAEGALERALGWTSRDALFADAAELVGLGVLSTSCAAVAGLFLAWALSRRLEIPLAIDPLETASLAVCAIFLPALSGLLAGTPARRRAAMDVLRNEA